MKTFNVPIKVISKGTIPVEAETYEEAVAKADDKAFWLYQAGAQTTSRELDFDGCEIEVDGDEIDLDSYREAAEE